MRLIHEGRLMGDDSTLEECRVTAGQCIHMILALKGGSMLALKKEKEAKKKAEEERIIKEEADRKNGVVVTPAGDGLIGIGIGGAVNTSIVTNSRPVQRQIVIPPAQIRAQKDISDLEAYNSRCMNYPNPDDIMNFDFMLKPDTGYWRGAKLRFHVSIPGDYPYKPPRVSCLTKIYHPNLDLQGNVCLNILRADWTAVMTVAHVLDGLRFLMYDPNPLDPLNHDAAALFRNDAAQFGRVVTTTLQGRSHGGESFPNLM